VTYLAHLTPRPEARVQGNKPGHQRRVAAAEGSGRFPAGDVESDVVRLLGGHRVPQLGGDLLDGHFHNSFDVLSGVLPRKTDWQ
jgi:hypothetical protein